MDEILFQNEDVCILDPLSKKGVLIYTRSSSKNICSEGLYSYNELRKVHPELGLNNRGYTDDHDDLIYFRAPYNYDVTSFTSSYGYNPINLIKYFGMNEGSLSIIRIDPDKTYVYSSEVRVYYRGKSDTLNKSRINFNTYLSKIKDNMNVKIIKGYKMASNILTYSKELFPVKYNMHLPWIEYFPIELNSEVIVKIPHIPLNWMVECYKISNNVIVSTLNDKNNNNLRGGNYNNRNISRKRYMRNNNKTSKKIAKRKIKNKK